MPRKKDVWFLIVLLICLYAQGFARDIFNPIGRSFALVEFMADSKFIENHEDAVETCVKNLSEADFVMMKNRDSIRVGEVYSVIRPDILVHKYSNEDRTIWLDMLIHSNPDTLNHYWKLLDRNKKYYLNMVNDNRSSVYLTVKTDTQSAIGALFNTNRIVFNAGIDLPFPVKENFDRLQEHEKDYVVHAFDELHRILTILAETLVDPKEWIYRPDPDRNLTEAERLYGLMQFWTEVKYNFAFFDQVPGLNWDHVLQEYIPLICKDQTTEEYYRNMQKLCALLKDGHTNVYPPVFVRNLYDRPKIALMNIQQNAFVEKTGVSLKDQIPAGSRIIQVNDTTVQEYLTRRIFPFISSSTEHILWDWGIRDLLTGKAGTSVKVTLEKPNGRRKDITLVRNSKTVREDWHVSDKKMPSRKLFEFKRLDHGIVYTALNDFRSDRVVREFEAHLDSIKAGRGLIIDLRNNGGGNSAVGYDIIKFLTNRPFLTSRWKTREHRAAFKAWGQYYASMAESRFEKMDSSAINYVTQSINYFKENYWYEADPAEITPSKGDKIDQPVAVLIGHNTGSAAEDFLIAMDHLKRAVLIGQKTFGSTGQPFSIRLPGGGSARICTKRDMYPDGREFVGYGIIPDILIEPSLEDHRKNRDRALEKAIEILKRPQNR